MKNLSQLSEMMVVRQSAVRNEQVPLLSKLHRIMLLRTRVVQIATVTPQILKLNYEPDSKFRF